MFIIMGVAFIAMLVPVSRLRHATIAQIGQIVLSHVLLKQMSGSSDAAQWARHISVSGTRRARSVRTQEMTISTVSNAKY